jgi:hypothetical protein
VSDHVSLGVVDAEKTADGDLFSFNVPEYVQDEVR